MRPPLLYGCASWVGRNVKPVIKLHNFALKQLLGTSKTARNDVCYAMVKHAPLPDLPRFKQHKLNSKMVSEISSLTKDSLIYAVDITTRGNTGISRTTGGFKDTNVPDMSSVHANCECQYHNHSHCAVHRSLNSNLSVHSV